MLLGGSIITVINDGPPTGYDSLGTVISTPVLTTVPGCSVQEHRTKRDLTEETDVVMARFRIFAPAGAPLTSTSRVVLGIVSWPLPDGATVFLVDGEPALWAGRNGTVNHIECYLKEQGG